MATAPTFKPFNWGAFAPKKGGGKPKGKKPGKGKPKGGKGGGS
jgi:hypothetical protein